MSWKVGPVGVGGVLGGTVTCGATGVATGGVTGEATGAATGEAIGIT
jgi:hypothetical protein